MGEELKDAAASKESKTLFIFTSFTYNIFQFNKSKQAKSLQSFLNFEHFYQLFGEHPAFLFNNQHCVK